MSQKVPERGRLFTQYVNSFGWLREGSAARAASIGEIGVICGSSFHAISTHHRNHDLEGRK